MENAPKASWQSSVWEIAKFVAVTLLIVIPIRTFIAQPFIVSGASMYPTFHDKEYLIIDELSYHLRAPTRGEVIVFKYPQDTSKYFIKRIIGLPGETIVVKNNEAFVKTGEQLTKIDEPYVKEPYWGNTEVSLGPTDYFVMGDNRAVSLDSRTWGPLPKNLITGRAFIRLFPVGQIGVLPGNTP